MLLVPFQTLRFWKNVFFISAGADRRHSLYPPWQTGAAWARMGTTADERVLPSLQLPCLVGFAF